MSGCTTTKTIIKTEVIVPSIYFPIFPDLSERVSLDEEKETVTISLDDYARICEYKLRVDEAERIYNKNKELYSTKD